MREEDRALAYLDQLEEGTMARAWGLDRTPEERRRIVLAALIFGRQFEERVEEPPLPPEDLDEKGFQRFLMALINAAISEFAEREGTDPAVAAELLGDSYARDYVLEFDEVLEAHAIDPHKSLNEHFREAIESREERAARSRRDGDL